MSDHAEKKRRSDSDHDEGAAAHEAPAQSATAGQANRRAGAAAVARMAGESGQLPWASYKHAHEIEQALRPLLPTGTSMDQVLDFCKNNGISTTLVDQTIYASKKISSFFGLNDRRWLLEFHFAEKALQNFTVSDGLITL